MRKQPRIPCGSRPTPISRPCSRPTSAGGTLADLVQQYKRDHEHDPSVAVADCRDLADAIRHATGSVGKVPGHQRRVGRRILQEACERLLRHRDEIRGCRSFADLIALVGRATEGIYRFGELAVYDTAFRLGVWLKLWPKAVYLHAGTRAGARALGLDLRRGRVDMAELPVEVRVLKPWQVEDFLCIFKRELAVVQQHGPER
ncbi:MAG: hypothetical protein NTY19_06665 [Planctomycetota bacterium]|nr:hypothetical protein [Planctomycetota bacterium]